jgi:outer membrane protein TolC
LGDVAASTITANVWEQQVEEHPSVILSRAQVDSARAALANSRSALWPAITASYSRSFVDREYFPGNPDWSASAVASLPIFGNGLTAAYFDIRSSKRDFRRAEEELRATREDVRSDLQSAWSEYLRAVDQVKVQSAFLEAARQRNGEADIRYSNGLMNYENWEQIVTDRVNFERSLIQAQRDAVVAEAAWERARGKGIGE